MVYVSFIITDLKGRCSSKPWARAKLAYSSSSSIYYQVSHGVLTSTLLWKLLSSCWLPLDFLVKSISIKRKKKSHQPRILCRPLDSRFCWLLGSTSFHFSKQMREASDRRRAFCSFLFLCSRSEQTKEVKWPTDLLVFLFWCSKGKRTEERE